MFTQTDPSHPNVPSARWELEESSFCRLEKLEYLESLF